MEALIGFAVGYWVGSRQGRKGLEQALDTAREIWTSPETRRVIGEGLSALEGLTPLAGAVGKRQRDTRNALIHGVIDEIMARRSARQAASAA